jgi:hypothetical protein
MNDLLRDGIKLIYKLVFLVPKILMNCYCELKLYIIPIEENQYKITSVQGHTAEYPSTSNIISCSQATISLDMYILYTLFHTANIHKLITKTILRIDTIK